MAEHAKPASPEDVEDSSVTGHGAETKDPSPAVTRALRLLAALESAAGVPQSLTELSRAIGAAKSSTSNICAVLEDARMIHRTDRSYRLGMRTAELGGAFAGGFNQVREFYGVVESIPVLSQEVVQIAMLDGHSALYLARHEGRRQRLGTPLGSRLPLIYAAAGNALLMAMPDAAVQSLLDEAEFRPETERSARNQDDVWEKIRSARSRGFAVDLGEAFPGVCGVAAPLEPWRPGDPPMAIGVALPLAEADYSTFERIGSAVLEAARALTNPMAARPLSTRPTAEG